MNEHNLFVVVEGLDGVGKTSVCKKLAEIINATYYKTPPEEFRSLKEFIDNQVDYETRFLYYLSSVKYASEKISDLLKENSVVCDRYVYSTVAYHNVMANKNFTYCTQLVELKEPDYVFCLRADETERMKRINSDKRTNSRTDKKLEKEKDLVKKIEQSYKEVCKDYHFIDTTNLNVDEVVQHITRIIFSA